MDGKHRGEAWLVRARAPAAIVAVSLALTYGAARALPPQPAFFLGLAAWFMVLVAATWPFVHMAGAGMAHGRRGFGGAALSVLALAGVVWTGGLLAKADMGRKLVAVQVNLPTTTPIRAIRGGTELVFDGVIEHGAAKALREVAARYPHVTRIRLGGLGGELREANSIRDFITEKGWNTYASGDCWSGCVVAYLGGVRRTIGPEAHMGFHSVSVWPFRSDARERALNAGIARGMIERGIDPAFSRHAWSKEHDGMWFPSHDELIRVGLVHAVEKP